MPIDTVQLKCFAPMKLETFPRTVFLTGATGVLGGRILKDLLQSTSSRIYCLARGKDPAHCQERVRSFLRVYDHDGKLEPAFLSRVTVLRGDVTQDRLGLSEPAFAELQSHTDITIHAAANTSLLLKYKRLEPINVQGTGRVIEFCLGTVEKNLSYVSTYTVMGDKTFDKSVRFQETDYDLGQGFKYMNYQRSKFRAEAMVRAAQERGLKWRIFRPGQIYGDSITGAYPHSETQVTGLFYDLFKTAMDTRVMPESYIHYDVVPVDYVSRGIVALSAGVENLFDVYHLTNPDAKTFSQVMGLLREIGYPIDLASRGDLQAEAAAGRDHEERRALHEHDAEGLQSVVLHLQDQLLRQRDDGLRVHALEAREARSDLRADQSQAHGNLCACRDPGRLLSAAPA